MTGINSYPSGPATSYYSASCDGFSMHAVLQGVIDDINAEIGHLDLPVVGHNPGGRAHEWSAQQVIGHLILGYRLTGRAMENRIKKGRPSQRQDRSWLQWALQLMILTAGVIPRGVPASKETTANSEEFANLDGRQLVDLLSQEAETMDAALDACRRKFAMERVATHPWLGPLRVDQWRRFHAVHGRHHIPQLRALKEQLSPNPVPIRIAPATTKLPKKMGVPAQRPLA